MSTYMFIRRDRAQSRKKHKEKKSCSKSVSADCTRKRISQAIFLILIEMYLLKLLFDLSVDYCYSMKKQ